MHKLLLEKCWIGIGTSMVVMEGSTIVIGAYSSTTGKLGIVVRD